MMTVQNPPPGYTGVTPYLVVKDAAAAIAWYERAFGAECLYKMQWGGKIGHAELSLAGGHFMLAEEFPDMGHLSPASRGGTSVSMLVYVSDADAAHARVMAEGATQDFPLETKPWGDRSAQVTDPFGHRWTIATHVEDVSNEEIDRRMAAMAPAS